MKLFKAGWYYDKTIYKGKNHPIWIIGKLPSGDFSALKQKADGTCYYVTIQAQEIDDWVEYET